MSFPKSTKSKRGKLDPDDLDAEERREAVKAISMPGYGAFNDVAEWLAFDMAKGPLSDYPRRLRAVRIVSAAGAVARQYDLDGEIDPKALEALVKACEK